MSSSRSSFVSGTIFGIILGVLLGHFALWQNVQPRPVMVPENHPLSDLSSMGMSYDLGERAAELPYFPEDVQTPSVEYPPPQFHEIEGYESPLANAIAVETVEIQTVEATKKPAVVEIATPAEEPKALSIEGAAPIEAHSSKNDIGVRKAIEEELRQLPEAQREIWFESLKEMHVDDALGVIRMWKALGGPIPGLGEDSLILAPQQKPNSPSTSPLLNSAHGTSNSEFIRQSIAVHRRNVLMSSTLGYLRVVPRFSEELFDGEPQITGVIQEFDFSPGSTLPTGNLLDLMIQGPGMFRVMDDQGQNYLTRRGRFSFNRDRQLTIIDTNREYVLQPPITIPEGLIGIEISENGDVVIQTASGPEKSDTTLRLTRLLNVQPCLDYHNGLQKYSGEGAEVVPGSHGCGTILQGYLEVSNVNVAIEQQLIEQLQKRLED